MAPSFSKSTQVTNWSTTCPNQDCSCGPAKLLIFPICFLPGLALLADEATKLGHPLPQIKSTLSSSKSTTFGSLLTSKTTVLAIQTTRGRRENRNSLQQRGHRLPFLSKVLAVFWQLPLLSLQRCEKIVFWLFCLVLYLFFTEMICNLFMPPNPEAV